MKNIARYCGQCTVWFWRKFWLSIYCPCCHKKMHEKLKQSFDVKRKEYFKLWRIRNRDKINKYKRDLYRQQKEKQNKVVRIYILHT